MVVGGCGWWWGTEKAVTFELEELKDETERPACEDLRVNLSRKRERAGVNVLRLED